MNFLREICNHIPKMEKEVEYLIGSYPFSEYAQNSDEYLEFVIRQIRDIVEAYDVSGLEHDLEYIHEDLGFSPTWRGNHPVDLRRIFLDEDHFSDDLIEFPYLRSLSIENDLGLIIMKEIEEKIEFASMHKYP